MNTQRSPLASPTVSLVVALAALALAVVCISTGRSSPVSTASPTPGILDAIDSHRAIRAGYGVFPPYTDEDPTTHRVSGVSVDIINEIARQLGVPVEWKRFNWNTMRADLHRGDIDIL